MQETIEQLYNGEIYPAEQLRVCTKGYKEAKNVAFRAHEEFAGKLGQAMKGELDELISKHMETSCLEDTQAFVDGFKLGAKLMAEIFWEDRGGQSSHIRKLMDCSIPI